MSRFPLAWRGALRVGWLLWLLIILDFLPPPFAVAQHPSKGGETIAPENRCQSVQFVSSVFNKFYFKQGFLSEFNVGFCLQTLKNQNLTLAILMAVTPLALGA